jgi:aminopeptidase N
MPGENLTKIEAEERAQVVKNPVYYTFLDLTTSEETFRSITRIDFDGVKGATTFVELIASKIYTINFNGKNLSVDDVFKDSRIELSSLEFKNTLVVEADCIYSRTGEGLHRFKDPVSDDIYVYTHFEVPDAKRVFSCFDQPDIKGTFRFYVVAPSYWKVISNTIERQVIPFERDIDIVKDVIEGVSDWEGLDDTIGASSAAGAGASSVPSISPSTSAAGTGSGSSADGLGSSAGANPASGAGDPAGGRMLWRFGRTCTMSTYLTAIAGGQFAEWKDSLANSDGRTIPLGLYSRRSLAKYIDVEEIFTITKQAFDHYAELYPVPYPYEKYDQIYCPEFNAGAMENIACVTITESLVFRTRTSTAFHERRAITIVHELAHMWFGDLVTTKWWNDLWLNESFAEYLSTLVTAEATKYRHAWVAFNSKEKSWALRQDQLRSSHPIAGPIEDIEDVLVNFDGITYAKGASALKQLVAWCGRDEFFKGITNYLKKYSYKNAELTDLLVELEMVTGRDLKTWSKLWLETQGINTLTPKIEVDEKGRITDFRIYQTAPKEHPYIRPHHIEVGFYDMVDEEIISVDWIPVDVESEETVVSNAVGKDRPMIVLLNDRDLTFAKTRFDDVSYKNVLSSLPYVRSPLAQSLMWSAVWDMTRDGLIPASDYIRLTLETLKMKSRSSVVKVNLAHLVESAHNYLPVNKRAAYLTEIAERVWHLAENAKHGSDAQLQFMLAYAKLVQTPEQGKRLQGLLDGTIEFTGIKIEKGLIWDLLDGLIKLGLAGNKEIDEAYKNDQSADGYALRTRALATIPTLEAKRAVLDKIITGENISNTFVRFSAEGFSNVNDVSILEELLPIYMDNIMKVWNLSGFKIADYYLTTLYPRVIANQNLLGAITKWYDENQDKPNAMLRLVSEAIDDTRRDLNCQKRYLEG